MRQTEEASAFSPGLRRVGTYLFLSNVVPTSLIVSRLYVGAEPGQDIELATACPKTSNSMQAHPLLGDEVPD